MKPAVKVEEQLQSYQKTVKMSSMFNNDLFHALSLHYLINNLHFPPDLGKIHPLDSNSIKSLKTTFQDQSMDKFFQARQTDQNNFPNQLVERTVILGLFWRSLLVEKMRADSVLRGEEFNPKTYLNENDPISIPFFKFMLSELKIPLYLYHSDSGESYSDTNYTDRPTLNLIINSETNECFLNNKIQPGRTMMRDLCLNEYIAQSTAYALEAEDIKESGCANSGTHLFLALALNPSLTPEALCNILAAMSKHPPVDSSSSFTSESSDESQSPLLNSSSDSSSSESIDEENSSSSEGISFKQKKFNAELDSLDRNLVLLKVREFHYRVKIKEIEQDPEKAEKLKEYQDAEAAAKGLYDAIAPLLVTFKKSNRTQIDYNVFEKASMEAIAIHKPILKNHRDFDKIIANIIGAILGLVVIYAAVLAINYVANGFHNTMWHSEGQKAVEQIEDNLINLKAFI